MPKAVNINNIDCVFKVKNCFLFQLKIVLQIEKKGPPHGSPHETPKGQIRYVAITEC
jgi:hypothetical protein